MKKICAVFAAVMTVATIWLFCSCANDPMQNVSERRSGFYTASGEGLTVTVVSGVRETPYVADGNVGELKPYTLVTVVPDSFDVDALYTYTATFGGSTYGGALTVHPFGASFSAEFDAEVSGGLTVTVSCSGAKHTFEMQSLVTSEMFTYDRAIDAAKTVFKDISGQYETRVRLINDPLGVTGLCWHVAFHTASDTCGVLLDPVTAKIMAVKK